MNLNSFPKHRAAAKTLKKIPVVKQVELCSGLKAEGLLVTVELLEDRELLQKLFVGDVLEGIELFYKVGF